MRRLEAALEIHYNKITNQDYDGVLIITGDEGKGKSNVALHILDWWYNKKNGYVLESDVKHISLDSSQFTADLKECKKYDCTVYDEAGDISNKRSMSKMNVLLSQAYQVIRGDNLLTILVLPSIFDLDGFFTKRRARGLIHVTKRGAMRYYSQRRLRKVISLNQNRIIKSLNVTAPTFVDNFPIYKGVLAKAYLEKKQEKMKLIREKLHEEMSEGKTAGLLDARNELIIQLKNKYGATKTAEMLDMNRQNIYKIEKKVVAVN